MFKVTHQWNRLKTCVVGSAYPPELFQFIKDVKLRNTFEKLAIETEEDISILVNFLKSFGITVGTKSIHAKSKHHEEHLDIFLTPDLSIWNPHPTHYAEEEEGYLLDNSKIIKTESYEVNLNLYVEEGLKWIKKKYGFNSRWQMMNYSKILYDKFFEYFPEEKRNRI